MKAAVIMPAATQLGGAEQMLLHLLRANRRAPSVDYHLAFLEEGPMIADTESLGYPVQKLQSGRLRDFHRCVATVRRLRGWLRREKPDVVLSWMGKAHLYAGPAAYLERIPAVWCQHAIPDTHWINRYATRIPAAAIFCCSRASQQAQEQLRPHRPTRVVYPAVDLERFLPERLPSPVEARAQLGLPPERPIMGMVARLQRQKGVHVFLEAACRVAQTHPDAYFVVVGGRYPLEPSFPEELERQIQQAGLEPRVHLAGQQTDIPLWMQAMDILVMPSIYPEGFGMVVIEAMALGKPVIASRSGGTVEIIEEGVDGLLVAPGDADAFAAAIRHTLNDTPGGRAFGPAAQRKARLYGADRLSETVAQRLQEVALRSCREDPLPAQDWNL